MPGLSLLSGSVRDQVGATESLFESVCYLEDDEVQTVLDDPPTLLGATGSPNYPVRTFETADAVVVLEGYVYDGFDPEALVAAVDEDRRRDLSAWLRSADGDFLLAICWEDRDDVTLLNDTFGRLPTYYARIGETTVVSRELGFVREVARRSGAPLSIDRLAAAQQLVFEHVLGTRTTFEGVRSIPPGSLVHVDEDGVDVDRLHQYDLGRTVDPDRSRPEIASELADRIAGACQRRQVEGDDTVVSLSGGLDSRVVVAGYAAADADFETVTFDNEHGLYEDDMRVARDIAETLDVPWSTCRVGAAEAHESTLLELKQGLNNVSMAYMLDFFEQLSVDRDAVTYATGDGGHRALVDETPPREPTSRTDLVDQLLESNARFLPAEAAAVTGVDEEAIVASVHERLATYPERDLAAQYDHFMFRERGLNFIQHGEDRNRYYCWSVSPFYAPSVFRYASACPSEHKGDRELFAAVLEELAPELLAYDYSNVGAPIGSLEFRAKQYAVDLLMRHKRVKDLVARFVKDERETTDRIGERITDRLSANESVEPLSRAAIEDVARDADSHRPFGLTTLQTLTMLAGSLEDDQPARQPTLEVS